MTDVPRITPAELNRRIIAGEDFTLIDTRNPQAWAESNVKLPRAIRVPVDQLAETMPDLPKDTPIAAYCT
jgi:rhodanese-related sulfurtransferase